MSQVTLTRALGQATHAIEFDCLMGHMAWLGAVLYLFCLMVSGQQHVNLHLAVRGMLPHFLLCVQTFAVLLEAGSYNSLSVASMHFSS